MDGVTGIQSTPFIAGHCRDLESVSPLARVRNNRILFQQMSNLFLPGM